MHSSSVLATFALAASTVLGRPSVAAPYQSAASEAVDGARNFYNDVKDGEWSDGGSWGQGNGWGSGRQGRPGWNGSPGGGEPGIDNTNNNAGRPQGQDQTSCMSREDAIKTAATFQSLIQGYTKEQALAALTPDFVDYSSAVSIIINRGGSGPEDVTAPIFTSREEFMAGHGTQEPIPFETLKVWSTCDGVVSMVWRSIRSAQGQENETAAVPVTGTAILETELAELSEGIELERAVAGGYNYRIHTLWSEFNTAAWLVNNGVLPVEEGTELTPVPETETTPSPPSNITKRAVGKRATKFDIGLA